MLLWQVMWDTKERTIVSNDSWAILKMLDGPFRPLGRFASPPPPLLPAHLAAAIEEKHTKIYDSLLNGVYRAGVMLIHGNQKGHDAAAAGVYEALGSLDVQLGTNRFLMGDAMTAVDLRASATLFRRRDEDEQYV